jgi:hypothetical protein
MESNGQKLQAGKTSLDDLDGGMAPARGKRGGDGSRSSQLDETHEEEEVDEFTMRMLHPFQIPLYSFRLFIF